MTVGDCPLMGSQQPPFEQCSHTIDQRQEVISCYGRGTSDFMYVTHLIQLAVGFPVISAHARAPGSTAWETAGSRLSADASGTRVKRIRPIPFSDSSAAI